MANPIAVSLNEVTVVKNIIEQDILESASLVNDTIFEDLQIVVLNGIENKDTKFVFKAGGEIASAYTPGDELDSTLGEMIERVLEVKPIWARVPDNLANYREKEPFSIAGLSDGGVQAPHIEFQLRQAAQQTAEQVRLNLFHGDRSLGKNKKFGLYDGFLKKIAEDKTNGLIAKAEGNLIEGIDLSGTPEDVYDGLVDFYQALDPRLRDAPEVLFYMTPQTRLKAVQGYLGKYIGLQSVDANKDGFRFVDMPNVILKPTTALGSGNGVIATVPNNFVYGCDLNTGNPHVNVMQDPKDAKIIIIQIDMACGTRINQVSADKFATTDGTFTAPGKPATTSGGTTPPSSDEGTQEP